MAGGFIEPELKYHIRPIGISSGLHDVIVQPGDVGHEGELVGWVDLDSMGSSVRGQPFDRRLSYRSVISNGMYCYMSPLVIGG